MRETDARLTAVVEAQPYPLLFVTISGAHLYGFASADSDYDLRGVHILPPGEVMGLGEPRETIEVMRKAGAVVAECATTPRQDVATNAVATAPFDLDLVTHDVKKFMLLMLRKNGYVLEQLYSPLVVHIRHSLS